MKPITKGKPADRPETRNVHSVRPANPHDTPPLVDAEALWAKRDEDGLTLEEIEKLASESAEEARKRAQAPDVMRAGKLPDIAVEVLREAGRLP